MKSEIMIITIRDQRIEQLNLFSHTIKIMKKKGKINQQISYSTIKYFNIRPLDFQHM